MSNLGEGISKKYSVRSADAIDTLNTLDGAFASMAQRVSNLEKAIDPNNLESIIAAKNDLAQIIGDLEKLQCNKLDAVETSDLHSGQQEAKAHRKALNKEVNNLLEQTQALYKQLNSIIQARVAQMALEQSTGPSNKEAIAPREGKEEPLGREEISKLLLLVSKASQNGYISNDQKNFIKDEICQRKGYLRQVVAERDITSSIAALTRIRTSSN